MVHIIVMVGAGMLIGAGINRLRRSAKGEESHEYGLGYIGLAIALIGLAI